MRDTTQLKKFKTSTINGTFNVTENKTFFCSKMMDIEDEIIVNNSSIQYYQLIDTSKTASHGYGYQNYNTSMDEDFQLLELITLKGAYQTINMMKQNNTDSLYNTRWYMNINAKNILIEYLFAKIKEARTFRSIKSKNFINNNINDSIRQYIINNIIDRYRVKSVDLYVRYYDIKTNSRFINTVLKQYDPQYDISAYSTDNKVRNINLERKDTNDELSDVIINYYQTKPSTDYKFDYYYDITYEKI